MKSGPGGTLAKLIGTCRVARDLANPPMLRTATVVRAAHGHDDPLPSRIMRRERNNVASRLWAFGNVPNPCGRHRVSQRAAQQAVCRIAATGPRFAFVFAIDEQSPTTAMTQPSLPEPT